MDIPYEVAGKEQFAVVAGSADGLAPAVCAVEPDVYNYLMFSMGYAVAPVAQHVLHQPLPELTEVDEEVEAPKQKIATNPRGRRPFAKRRRGMAEEMARRLQEQLRSATSAASGSSGGFEKIFRKYDKDRSGNLTADEFRRLIRLELRIRPERLSDKDIDALVEALDDDGSGTLGTEEIIDFIKRGSATFFAGSAEDLGAGNEQDVVDEESTLAENLPSDFTLPECASTDLQSSRALSFDSFTANADVVSYAEAHPEAYEYDNFGVLHESSSLGSLHGDPVAVGTAPLGYVAYVAPELHQALVQLSGIPQTAATIWPEHMKQEQEVDVKPERKKKRYLSVDLARRLQQMLKIASYSQSLGRVLKKHDKDGSGTFEEDELKSLFRRQLRIPPETLSDKDISSLLHELDEDGSGKLTIDELVEFVDRGPSYLRLTSDADAYQSADDDGAQVVSVAQTTEARDDPDISPGALKQSSDGLRRPFTTRRHELRAPTSRGPSKAPVRPSTGGPPKTPARTPRSVRRPKAAAPPSRSRGADTSAPPPASFESEKPSERSSSPGTGVCAEDARETPSGGSQSRDDAETSAGTRGRRDSQRGSIVSKSRRNSKLEDGSRRGSTVESLTQESTDVASGDEVENKRRGSSRRRSTKRDSIAEPPRAFDARGVDSGFNMKPEPCSMPRFIRLMSGSATGCSRTWAPKYMVFGDCPTSEHIRGLAALNPRIPLAADLSQEASSASTRRHST